MRTRRDLLGHIPHIRAGGAYRSPIEIRTLLDGEGLMLDVAVDMSIALEQNIAPANWALDPAVHHHVVGFDPACDGRLTRYDK